MANIDLPSIRDSSTIEGKIEALYDAYFMTQKSMKHMLENLDEDNVIRAESVIAEWVYAGSVTTDQLIAGEAKIGTALIDELIVGTNVIMGANATISWSQVSSQPYIPTLPAYITSTKITSTTIESPNITGGTITGGTVNGGTIHVYNNIQIDPVSEGGIQFQYASVYYDPSTWSLHLNGMQGVWANGYRIDVAPTAVFA